METKPRNGGSKWLRKRLRFSLRTFLFFVLLVGLLLGAYITFDQRVKSNRRLVQRIEDAGGFVSFEHEVAENEIFTGERAPKFLLDLFGDDAFHQIEIVSFYPDSESEKGMPEELFHDVLALPKLRDLQLFGQNVTDDWVDRIAQTRIETLTLVDPNLSASGLDSLVGLESLRNLDLSGAFLTDRHLEILPQLENLEGLSLYLEGASVTSGGLEHLNDCKNLVGLALKGSDQKFSLAMISDLEKLEYLNVSYGSFSFASPEVPKFADSLRTLSFSQTSIDNEQRENLAHFRSLKELWCIGRPSSISNVDFSAISRMKELEVLATDNGITSQHLGLLGQLNNLKQLHLGSGCCTYTAKELDFVSELKNLERLQVNPYATRIGDLDFLLDLPELQSLYLFGNVLPNVGQALYFKFEDKLGFFKMNQTGGLRFHFFGLGSRWINPRTQDYGGMPAGRSDGQSINTDPDSNGMFGDE